jgi:hypothetical protein
MTADEGYGRTLRRIDEALTADERAKIVEVFTGRNPHYKGAHFDDILEMVYDHDSYVSQVDPFFEAHPLQHWPFGSAYAAYAICAQGRDLTAEAVRDLLGRAGLLS